MTMTAKFVRVYQRLSLGLNQAVEGVLFALGLTMAIIVCTQVFFRYVVNDSLFWSEEAARYLLVWLTFLGATSAYYRGVHPKIESLAKLAPPKVRLAARVLVHFISLALFAVLIVYGVKFSYFVRLQISPALNIPKWTVTAVIPVSGVIFCIHNLRLLLEEFTGGAGDR
ncbi:TRAP-type C4-dicarboxylate transport system, small permease component [Desulfatibacillum alkenivorans DSM 16219]|uniref:TRAP-type C4-dicarboxylate transport system, small permease component n=1 Tax=Desulfatibacillum alkenivorans DSM 16219 TaxID=1121393 RepID=A0A1M6TUG6_9BACT|nr:TRAP transporter small permease [Desulfatibacillum alkenivorans]SHK60569.1 TRAP-type C4-dicarboxylate transport system, small permease component [Desulfatibacillum alkenivorans DSM 16219]